jgi:hypothetical protein
VVVLEGGLVVVESSEGISGLYQEGVVDPRVAKVMDNGCEDGGELFQGSQLSHEKRGGQQDARRLDYVCCMSAIVIWFKMKRRRLFVYCFFFSSSFFFADSQGFVVK